MLSAIPKIRAIVGRELYGYLASPVAYVFIVAFLAISSFFTFMLGRFFEANQASLESFFFWHPWLYMGLVPAIGMRMWAEERRSNTIELLFTLPVAQWHAILAKYIAGCLILALSLVLTFPMVIMVGQLGSPDYGVIASGYIGSLLVAMAFLAISSLTSALTRNQVVSFILSWGLCLLIILCGWPPVTNLLRQGDLVPVVVNFLSWYAIVWIVLALLVLGLGRQLLKLGEMISIWGLSLLVSLASAGIVLVFFQMTQPFFDARLSGGTPTWFVDLVSRFSVVPHYEQLQIGVVDSRALIYFASIIIFALFGTHVVLQRRRSM